MEGISRPDTDKEPLGSDATTSGDVEPYDSSSIKHRHHGTGHSSAPSTITPCSSVDSIVQHSGDPPVTTPEDRPLLLSASDQLEDDREAAGERPRMHGGADVWYVATTAIREAGVENIAASVVAGIITVLIVAYA